MGQKLLGIVTIAIFSLSTAICFGQADPNNPTSPNYRGKSSGPQKKYFATLGASMGRGFDEFAESVGTYNFSGSYVAGDSSFTLNADYIHPLDGDTDDTQPWRFEDVEIVWNAPALNPIKVADRSINLVPRLTYRAPVSGTSRAANSFGSLEGNLIALMNVGRFAFILSPRISLSYHEFETADEAGEIKNVPVAATLVTAVRMSVINNLFFTVSAFAQHGWDYDFGSAPVNGAASNLYYQVTPKWGLQAFVSWRDRVYTNNSLFDDETSELGLGLIANF